MTLRSVALTVLASLYGCGSSEPPFGPQYYVAWDGVGLVCGVAIDDDSGVDFDEIRGAIEWAAENQQVFVVYGHEPGVVLSANRLERLITLGEDAGVPFLSFADLLDDETPRAGIALTFDDDFVDAWYGTRDLLRAHDVRATYFVTRAQDLTPAQWSELRILRDDGHAIENHGHKHRNAREFVAEHSVDRYLADEVVPGLEALRAAGFDPRSYAYPFGSYSTEIDDAVAEYARFRRGNTRCPR